MDPQDPELSNLLLIDLHPKKENIISSIRSGLQKSPCQLPAWLLYDKNGSELFAQICKQPEYTLTNAEVQLINENAERLSSAMPKNTLVVEFGAGEAKKVSPILQKLNTPLYIAIDISKDFLMNSIRSLQVKHQNVPIMGVCADYSCPIKLTPPTDWNYDIILGFFPGSSIGNFSPGEAVKFLINARKIVGKDGMLLVGVDEPGTPSKMESSYNDKAGYSAKFALNVMERINRDLSSKINQNWFNYSARWDKKHQRIIMSLMPTRKQDLTLENESFSFLPGTELITEYSYKYNADKFLKLASLAGWRGCHRWHDRANHFSLHLLTQGDDARTNT